MNPEIQAQLGLLEARLNMAEAQIRMLLTKLLKSETAAAKAPAK